MALQSKCVKCDGTRFEMKLAKIEGSNFKHSFVQCAHCGGVVGVVSEPNTNALIVELAKKLDVKIL